MPNNLSFQSLRDANVLRGIEWFRRRLNLKDNLFTHVELGGEVGEVQELILQLLAQTTRLGASTGKALNWSKKLDRQMKNYKGGRKLEEVRAALIEELADVVICVDNIAQVFQIDLGQAVQDKFNATSTKYGLKTTLFSPSSPEVTLIKALGALKVRVARALPSRVVVGHSPSGPLTVPPSTVLKAALVKQLPAGSKFKDFNDLAASLTKRQFEAVMKIGKWERAPDGVSSNTLLALERKGLIKRRWHPDCPERVKHQKPKLTAGAFQWAWASLAK